MISVDVANLHAAILADPSDLAARYAYADALDEAGSDHRAAFVRASIAGDHVGASTMLDPLAWWAWFGNPDQPQQDREKRLRVNIQAQADGVLIHVWAKGERIHWGYQAVIRNGLLDEYRGPISTWLEGLRDYHPVTVYRPSPVVQRGRPARFRQHQGAAGVHTRLWQDQRVGRLYTLDLRAVCRVAGPNGFFHASHVHAFRPWRGLGRVLLPGNGTDNWRRHLMAQWSQVLTPPTRVELGEPLPEENEA